MIDVYFRYNLNQIYSFLTYEGVYDTCYN
jgi:hypothetical protein